MARRPLKKSPPLERGRVSLSFCSETFCGIGVKSTVSGMVVCKGNIRVRRRRSSNQAAESVE